MSNLDRVMAEITPRAATVTLLLFDRIVREYGQARGVVLDELERETVRNTLRMVIKREAHS